jgi:AraC family ethanolamine operon transcriptional activator
VVQRVKLRARGVAFGPRLVGRVDAFIEQNFPESITLAQLCAVAGCSSRLLQRTFLRQHGVPPMRHLQRRRLAEAHRLLQSGTPGMDVTYAATCVGLPHMGRFAAAYRNVFSELPSQTLARAKENSPDVPRREGPVPPATRAGSQAQVG